MTSTGSAGDCYDNAMAESFFATLECELIKRRSLHTHAEARGAIFQFIEGWYNTKRRHSALGYLSPNEFERRTAPTATPAQGDARGHDRTGLEPCQIDRPGIHNHPLGRPATPVSERDLLPSAIAHLSAGGDSPQPSTESGVTPVQEVGHVSDRHEVNRREHPEPGEPLVAHQLGLSLVVVHAKASLGVEIEIDADETPLEVAQPVQRPAPE